MEDFARADFRWVFDEVVRRCMSAGLVKGEGFAVDASIVAADASHQYSVQAGEHIDWSNPEINNRAVREYLEALDGDALAEVMPRRVSLSDPQSRWTAATGDRAFFAYSTNYLIDTAHGVIIYPGCHSTKSEAHDQVNRTRPANRRDRCVCMMRNRQD